MAIWIREARSGDGEAIARLHAEMGAYYADLASQHFQSPDIDGLSSEVDADLNQLPEGALALVAEDQGAVVGSLWAELVPSAADANRQIDRGVGQSHLRIDYVVTSAERRRQGVGAQLVEAAEDWAREKGAKFVEATTYRPSPLSFPFWTERMGFSERSVNLRKPLN